MKNCSFKERKIKSSNVLNEQLHILETVEITEFSLVIKSAASIGQFLS